MTRRRFTLARELVNETRDGESTTANVAAAVEAAEVEATAVVVAEGGGSGGGMLSAHSESRVVHVARKKRENRGEGKSGPTPDLQEE